MSKSIGNHIPMTVFGNDKKLRKTLASCATDPKRVMREDAGNPDDCPTIGQWHKIFSTDADNAWVREGCTTAGIGCVDCKGKLADNMTEHFKAFVDRRAELVANPQRVYDVLVDGAAKAGEIAKRTMADVHKRLGLWRPPVAKA
jgi:tryptophanyl-tRNA synthetase